MASQSLNIVYPSTNVREKIIQRSSPPTSSSSPSVHFSPSTTTKDDNTPQQNNGNQQQQKKGMKKKKKWHGDRSSLNSRYKKPKVGTRKYQRWLNEMYLNHDWTTLAEEMEGEKKKGEKGGEEEEEIDILLEANEECIARPNFSFFPEELGEEQAEEMFDFWYGGVSCFVWGEEEEKGEEGEGEGEKGVVERKREEEVVREDVLRFWKIPRLARKAVARCCHSLFLQELEEDLRAYLIWVGKRVGEGEEEEEEGEEEEGLAVGDEEEEEFVCSSVTYECVLKQGRVRKGGKGEEEGEEEGGEWGELEFLFPDSLTRFLAHSVCRYYGLSSKSWGKEGNRKTTVFWRGGEREMPSPPSVSLKNFILCSYLSS